MFIKKLRIFNNYKRFHDLTIDLGDNPKRIIALVGPNGCGKSSVFDAMIYHNRAYGGYLGNSPQNRAATYHFMSGSEKNDYRSVEILFSDGRSFADIKNERGNSSIDNTVFSFRSSYRYNSSINVQEIKAVDSIEQNSVGASTASDIDQRMEDNYRRLMAKYREHIEMTDSKPSEGKTFIIGELNKAIKSCLSLEITNLGNVEGGKGSLYFKKPDSNNEFPFDVLSSGEKEVVDLLIDLYLRRDSYNDTVYLIDEPELHISTTIQKKLMIEIDKMIGENCQIWIATHSIGLLRALQDDLKDKADIIRFDENNEWAKTAFVLSPMAKTRKNWQQIFATALDDLTALLAPKRIVYCEGRDRPASNGTEKGFDAEVFNTIFQEEFPDILFVSAGGNTELDQRSEIAISIIGKVLPKTEILLLKDRDMGSGKLVTESDRLEYLKLNSSNHRVLKRFEIENYLFDKEVLKKYCESNGKKFDEISYNALGFDVENDDIKNKCTKIKNICGVVGSINVAKFKIALSAYITYDMPLYTELKKIVFDRA